MNQLKRIQNNAVEVVYQSGRRDGEQLVLHELHWLPVTKSNWATKTARMLRMHCQSHSSPGYLYDLLNVNSPTTDMRSAESKLVIPNASSKH